MKVKKIASLLLILGAGLFVLSVSASLFPFRSEARAEGGKQAKAVKQVKKSKPAGESKAKKSEEVLPPALIIVQPHNILAKKLSVGIMGAGFREGQDICILFTDENGMETDIGESLQPTPVVGKSGAWNTTWIVDDFIKAKIVKPGVFTLTVTDDKLIPLAQAAIGFTEAPKPPAADKPEKKTEGKK